MVRSLLGTYVGFVEDVNDPEQLGRVKVRAPLVYGPVNGAVGTEDIPWAMSVGLPAGGSPDSGGMNWLPVLGDEVCLRFLDGEPEKPIWEWGMQTRSQRDALPFRRYNGQRPNAETLFTRHRHILLLDQDGWTMTTRAGYALTLQDADPEVGVPNGLWALRTSKGHSMTLEDETDTLTTFVSQIMSSFDDALYLGDSVAFRLATFFDANGGNLARLRGQRVELGSANASDPVVRRSDLQAALNTVIRWANAHAHTGNLGSPTSPPLGPLQVTARGSSVSFSA